MRRVVIVVALGSLLAGAPSAGATVHGSLAPGQLAVSLAFPNSGVAAFGSGVPLVLEADYHPRSGNLTRAALRVVGGQASCPRRPSAADRRVELSRFEPGKWGVTRKGVTLTAGASRVCAWFDEGRGFGAGRRADVATVPALWGAGVFTYALPGSFVASSEALASGGVTSTFLNSLPRSSATGATVCEHSTETQTQAGGDSGFASAGRGEVGGTPGGECLDRRFTARVLSGPDAGQAADIPFTLDPGAPPTVHGFTGDCFASLVASSEILSAANVRDLLHAVGCRLGHAYRVPNPYSAHVPGGAWQFAYRGNRVELAPRDTVVDVVFDGPVNTPAPDIGPPDAPGAGPTPSPAPPPRPPDPAPTPGGAYAGPPAASTAPGCTPEVKVGPIDALAACWRAAGDEAVSTGRVRLNGLDMTPGTTGGEIRINRRTFRVVSRGPVELRAGPLSLRRSELDWARPDQVFEIAGAGRAKGDKPKFTVKGQKIFALAVGGSVKAQLDGGRTKLTITVSVPDEPALKRLDRFAGASGELTVAADNQAGLIVDQAKFVLPGFKVGFAEVQEAEATISQPSTGIWHFDGQATVFPFTASRIGLIGELGFGPQDGYFKVSVAAENLNRLIAGGLFLQKIGAGFQVNPFGLTGSAGVTWGPQFRLGGELISAARLDGSISYLSGTGGDPSSLELAGALDLAEAHTADGKAKLEGSTVTVSGNLKLEVAGYGLEGALDGWFDGTRAFDVEGDAAISLPGPDERGEAVLSSAGAAACRHGLGPDVGFGYRWGEGLRGLTIIANSCDLGPWRAVAAARGAQVGGVSLRVRGGTRRLAIQVLGTGGPPRVLLSGPSGRRITAGSGPDASAIDATSYYAEDPVTRATYLVVDRPRPGTWTVTGAGGAPVAGVRTAAPLAPVRVHARVRGSGARRQLRYTTSGLGGRRVTFVEALGGRRRVLGTTSRRRGTLRFSVPSGSGRRAVLALITRRGLATDTPRIVARYTATARPATPRRVRIRRTPTTRVITWRGSTALRYEVDVALSDGRRLHRLARPGTRSATITTVASRTRATVTVRARDDRGVAGAATRRRG